MATKTKSVAEKLRELEADLAQQQQLLDALSDPNSDVGASISRNILDITDLIQELKSQQQQLALKRERLRKKSAWAEEQDKVREAMDKYFMGYIIPEQKFIYCKDFGREQNNVQFNMFRDTGIIRMLNKMTGMTIQGRDANEIIDYFQESGRDYYSITSSFNRKKWDESDVYNKMSVIREHWLKPDFERAGDYDPLLDVLIAAVAGGKQENIDHLEQFIGFKYLYPDRTANTPNIDAGGMPGGNGKTVLTLLLTTIFTPSCVIQAHSDELQKFNANWEMAVILYYDEPEEKELSAAKLKQKTGGEDMRIEKKGIDATMADRNYNFLFLSNNERGVVQLSGGSDGGEDRRYSVITTDLVLYDLLRQAGNTDQEAREKLNYIAQTLVKDREQVARWLAHIIEKHRIASMTVLPALHSEDYHRRFQDQKDSVTEAFDRILPVFVKNGCISANLLADLVRVMTENNSHKTKNVLSKFGTYLTRRKVEFDVREQASIKMLWQDEDSGRIQHKAVVVPGANPLTFEYFDVSNRRWKKDMPEINVLSALDLRI